MDIAMVDDDDARRKIAAIDTDLSDIELNAFFVAHQ
jgi:hypothetical protein